MQQEKKLIAMKSVVINQKKLAIMQFWLSQVQEGRLILPSCHQKPGNATKYPKYTG